MKKILLVAALAGFVSVSCVKDEVYSGELPVEEVAQTLCINEVCPNQKKIELYNTGKKEINLSGCSMLKDDSDLWELPSVKLAAGAVVVFTAKSSNPADGPSFGLSATKGFKLELLDKKGSRLDLLDNSKGTDQFFSFDETQDDQTLGRKTDGDSQWVIFNPGSIGSSNSTGKFSANWGK